MTYRDTRSDKAHLVSGSDKKYRHYIKSVIREIPVYGKRKKKIELDLLNSLQEREVQSGENADPVQLMGNPSDIASEFRENLGLSEIPGFEYISETEIFGLPLIHVNFKRNGIAKGFFAIGVVAAGVVSLGVVAIGLLSFGAFGMGILAAFGAVAFSGLISAGAAAFSIGMSLGAVAMANYYAIGAFAQANIAIGAVAHGIVAVFKDSGQGDFLVQLPANRGEVQLAVQAAFPTLEYFWVNFVLFPF